MVLKWYASDMAEAKERGDNKRLAALHPAMPLGSHAAGDLRGITLPPMGVISVYQIGRLVSA